MSENSRLKWRVRQYELAGYVIEQQYDVAVFGYRVRMKSPEGVRVERIVTDTAGATQDDAIIEAIEQMVRQLKANPPSTDELIAELRKYKDIVKQLSFELEMSKDTSSTHANVQSIRKLALEQAAEFVMDYGIPKDGTDLEELCKKIVGLKETKAMAMERALTAMTEAFKGKDVKTYTVGDWGAK